MRGLKQHSVHSTARHVFKEWDWANIVDTAGGGWMDGWVGHRYVQVYRTRGKQWRSRLAVTSDDLETFVG